MLSQSELAQMAGVDPWALDAKIAVGDPAQVESRAAAFYQAAGDMSSANATQATAATYVAEGYTVAGSSPVDFAAQAKSTAATPEHLSQIGKVLDGVAAHLDAAIAKSAAEVQALGGELNGIEAEYTQFMQSIGHHLPPDDQEAVRTELIAKAVGAVKSHGAAIDATIKGYEELVVSAQRSMSDLGYVPPTALDDLYGDGAAYVRDLQAKARAAADRILNNHTLDGNWAKDVHQVASDITPFLNDPYFAAAFYGQLGPQMTNLLPQLFYASGSSTAGNDIATFSHLFGTAVTNAQDDPQMSAVADSFLNTPPDAPVAWNRGAMVSHGSFPPDWLAKAARYNVLDDFAKNGAYGFGGFGYQGTPNGPFAYNVGLPDNTVALWTQDLGQNPAAAREALATMGNGNPNDVTIPSDPSAAYQDNIHKLIAYGKAEDYPGDVARAYGAAFSAASGANTELDGAHSAAAASFARALFTDLGRDSGDVQPVAADDFARIGGSYVQEMAAGAGLEGTSIGDAGTAMPGQHPAFAIPTEVTRSIMSTFVGDAAATQTFDNYAGRAQHDALVAAAHTDMGLPPNDAKNMEHVAQAYGGVAGTENSVTRAIVGARDESEAHQQELIRSILSAGVDLIPGEKIAENVPGTLWDIGKHVTNMGLEQTFGATSDPRFDALNDTSHAAALVGAYQQAAILHEAGYPGTTDIPPALIDPRSGHMLPAGTVLHDANLRQAFDDYMRTEGRRQVGGAEAIYDRTLEGAAAYQYGFDLADTRDG